MSKDVLRDLVRAAVAKADARGVHLSAVQMPLVDGEALAVDKLVMGEGAPAAARVELRPGSVDRGAGSWEVPWGTGFAAAADELARHLERAVEGMPLDKDTLIGIAGDASEVEGMVRGKVSWDVRRMPSTPAPRGRVLEEDDDEDEAPPTRRGASGGVELKDVTLRIPLRFREGRFIEGGERFEARYELMLRALPLHGLKPTTLEAVVRVDRETLDRMRRDPGVSDAFGEMVQTAVRGDLREAAALFLLKQQGRVEVRGGDEEVSLEIALLVAELVATVEQALKPLAPVFALVDAAERVRACVSWARRHTPLALMDRWRAARRGGRS